MGYLQQMGVIFSPSRFTKYVFILIKADYQNYEYILFLRIFDYDIFISIC